MKKYILTAMALIGLTLSVQSAVIGENLIVNGSFESPDVPVNTYQIFGTIPGWIAIGNGDGIEIQDHAYRGSGTPFDGQQHVELDAWRNTRMIQGIPTAPGVVYQLSFAYTPRPYIPEDSNVIDVYVNGTLIANLTGDGRGFSDSQWEVYHYSITATGEMTTLEFEANGISDSLGGYVDDVRFVQSVPEGGIGLAAMIFGFGGLIFARKKLA